MAGNQTEINDPPLMEGLTTILTHENKYQSPLKRGLIRIGNSDTQYLNMLLFQAVTSAQCLLRGYFECQSIEDA
jgi:hypothetical protein